MTRKFLSLLLMICFIFNFLIFAVQAESFTDVSNSHNNFDAISALANDGVLTGYPNGEFKPDNNITRAEFTTVLVREFKIFENNPSQTCIFSDVPASYWANDYIRCAYIKGIINGIGNGMFAPESPVTYEQVIKMMVAALGYNQDAINEGGYPDGYLIVGKELNLTNNIIECVGMPASRAMVAQIVYNGRNAKKQSSSVAVEAPKSHYPNGVPFGDRVDLFTDDNTSKIYYTTDGSMPTTASELYEDIYTENIYIDRSLTLKAIAVNENGEISNVTTYEYKQPIGDKIYSLVKFANDNVRSPKLNDTELEKLFGEILRTLNFCWGMEDGEIDALIDKCKEILLNINPNCTELEREKIIHDSIVLAAEYDIDNYKKNTVPTESYTVYGLLVKGTGVCEAYASATNVLLNLAGVENIIVSGQANNGSGWEGHAWNIVKIDGKEYHLDTTWDDPAPDRKGEVSYNYFNKTDDEMRKNHKWDDGNIEHSDSDTEITLDNEIGIVPNVVGMTEYEAYTILNNRLLGAVSRYVESNGVSNGTVISQSVPENTQFPYLEGLGVGYVENEGIIEQEDCLIILEVAAIQPPSAEIDKNFAEINVGETVKFTANITQGFNYEWSGANMRSASGQSGSNDEVCAWLEESYDTPECHVTGLQPGIAYLILNYNYDFDYENWETSKSCVCEIKVVE